MIFSIPLGHINSIAFYGNMGNLELSSSIGKCRYASQISKLEEIVPEAIFAKTSSTFGIGYCSSIVHLLMVTLKSPLIRIDPSAFTIGTIGLAHSEKTSGEIIPVLFRPCL